MTEAPRTPAAGASPGKAPPPAADLTSVLRSRGYHALMLAAAVLGLPIAVIAFGFLAAVSWMEKWVWQTVPAHFGSDQPKAWYPALVLTLAGALVGLLVARAPGRGGHVAANGFGGLPKARTRFQNGVKTRNPEPVLPRIFSGSTSRSP